VHKESPDSGALVARLAPTDAHSFRIREANADAGRGEEDQGFDPRRAFPVERILFAEKSGEFAALEFARVRGYRR
jgi:antitoxin (DNA-binding transcriptional repressor) of toxin-antitoxin stability system